MRKTGLKILVLSLLLVIIGSVGVSAQTSNLLINGGLEEDSFGQYPGRRGGEFPIALPSGWNYWIGPQNGDRINFAAKIAIRPHPGPGPSPTEGSRALNIDCGFYICTVAIYQQVANIQANSNVTASAWSQVKACNLGGGTSCGSAIESGSQTRIGIDPNGGTDPNDTDVVWSGWVKPHDQWLQQSTSATATGTSVTVFLYSTQSNISDLNKTYWDATSLTGGGSGGAATGAAPVATAVPTAPPSVPFVVQQGAQPDGSIVHTVQAGDTIDSIAYAYGVGRNAIMELNNISDPRIIQLGQKLIIKAADASSSASEETTEAPADSPTDAPAEPTEASATEETSAATGDVAATEEVVSESTTEPTTEAQVIAPVGQQPTATVPLATAPVVVANAGALDPSSTTASVCVMLFNDADQNRIQEQGEDLLKGGTISISTGTDAAQTYETDGLSEPHCFEGLPAGDYTAIATAPDGFGLTTPDQLRLRINPGATINVGFGAAEGVQPLQPPPADAGPLNSETVSAQTAQESTGDRLLSISGLVIFGVAAVVLVGGLGLALVMRRR